MAVKSSKAKTKSSSSSSTDYSPLIFTFLFQLALVSFLKEIFQLSSPLFGREESYIISSLFSFQTLTLISVALSAFLLQKDVITNNQQRRSRTLVVVPLLMMVPVAWYLPRIIKQVGLMYIALSFQHQNLSINQLMWTVATIFTPFLVSYLIFCRRVFQHFKLYSLVIPTVGFCYGFSIIHFQIPTNGIDLFAIILFTIAFFFKYTVSPLQITATIRTCSLIFSVLLLLSVATFKFILPLDPRPLSIYQYYNPKAQDTTSFPMIHPTHSNIRLLNTTKSLTGQVVVGEIEPGPGFNYSTPMRYLRVDRSLLGGVWLPNFPTLEGSQSPYPIFYIEEGAQYLVPSVSGKSESKDGEEDNNSETKNAILLGLGVGTAAKELANSGYSVDMLEIDPAVYENAVKYFDLKSEKYTPLIMNAKDWIDEYTDKSGSIVRNKKYNIIIHDFFSEGNGLEELYSVKAFSTIREKILKEEGVLVVNIFGSVNGGMTAKVLLSLLEVFKGNCDMFHDSLNTPNPKTGIIEVDYQFEYLNLAIFCRNPNFKINFDQKKIQSILKRDLRGIVLSTLQQRKIRIPSRKKLRSRVKNADLTMKEHRRIMDSTLPKEAWAFY